MDMNLLSRCLHESQELITHLKIKRQFDMIWGYKNPEIKRVCFLYFVDLTQWHSDREVTAQLYSQLVHYVCSIHCVFMGVSNYMNHAMQELKLNAEMSSVEHLNCCCLHEARRSRSQCLWVCYSIVCLNFVACVEGNSSQTQPNKPVTLHFWWLRETCSRI